MQEVSALRTPRYYYCKKTSQLRKGVEHSEMLQIHGTKRMTYFVTLKDSKNYNAHVYTKVKTKPNKQTKQKYMYSHAYHRSFTKKCMT